VAGLDISKIIANVEFHNGNINEIIDNFKSENADNKTQLKLHPNKLGVVTPSVGLVCTLST